jgi:hypothetical protein
MEKSDYEAGNPRGVSFSRTELAAIRELSSPSHEELVCWYRLAESMRGGSSDWLIVRLVAEVLRARGKLRNRRNSAVPCAPQIHVIHPERSPEQASVSTHPG